MVFEIDPFRKQMLLTGQDAIALTLGYESRIAEYEAGRRSWMPWLPTLASQVSRRSGAGAPAAPP